jgi:hypothetical protein
MYCFISSQDSKVMLWDIRRAKGALMVLDQHNGDTSAGPNSGKLSSVKVML